METEITNVDFKLLNFEDIFSSNGEFTQGKYFIQFTHDKQYF